LGWSLSTSQPAGIHQAAERLHLMTIDLIESLFIEEYDLAAANVLYKTLCKKMGRDACQCCISPLISCPELNQGDTMAGLVVEELKKSN